MNSIIDETRLELNSAGVSDDVIDFIRLAENGGYIVYPCQYPPVDDGGIVPVYSYPEVFRGRKTCHAIEKESKTNARPARFFNPKNEDCLNGKMPLFYTPDYVFLKNAIIGNDGVLHLFEGDKDTWTALSAGVFNSAGLFSASSDVSKDLIRQLKDIGVKIVYYYPDNDNAGIEMATRLHDAFGGETIQVRIMSLPVNYNDIAIKDTSDVWLACQCDADVFIGILKNLKVWHLPTTMQIDNASNTKVFEERLYRAIEAKLGVKKFNGHGWSENIACIFVEHEQDDRSPAFGWNNKTNVARCFKCGQTWLAKDVAQKLGINYRDYINRELKNHPLPSMTTDDMMIRAVDSNERMNATLNVMNDPYLAEVAELERQYDVMPDDSIMSSLSDALVSYKKRLTGVSMPTYAPIPNPLEELHHLGGNCRVWARPLMGALIGVSGGNKTTILNSMATRLAYGGYNVLVFSPEWLPEKNADRTVQQAGGVRMSKMSLLNRYYYEQTLIASGQLDPNSSDVFGEALSEDEIARTYLAIDEIEKNMKGSINYLTSFSPSITHLLAQLRSAHKRLANLGKKLDAVFIDYGQMIQIPENHPKWNINRVVNLLKVETNAHGWATIFASQARKTDAEAVASGDGTLGATSGNALSDYEFNWMVTLNPQNDVIVQSVKDPVTGKMVEKRLKQIKVVVVKDSEGPGNTPSNPDYIIIDVDRQSPVKKSNDGKV